jgi:hypothetical protein
MKVSELIEILTKYQKTEGDNPVRLVDLTGIVFPDYSTPFEIDPTRIRGMETKTLHIEFRKPK